MRKLILNSIIFICIFALIILFSLFLIPNRRIVNNSLYANIDKHHRLDSLPSPKIVFVGGSNLAYGLNSKRVEDSLHMSVVNMGLHAGFGLKFILNEVKPYIKKGDIVVLSPEYHHFYSANMLNGEKVLVALLFEVDRKNLKYITFSQAIHLIPGTIQYAVSKLMLKQLDMMEEGVETGYEKQYKRNSFNKYGDEVMHWGYPNHKIIQMSKHSDNEKILPESIDLIADFDKYTTNRKAKLIIIPPSFMSSTYKTGYEKTIDNIDEKLKNQNTPFVIPPRSFIFKDSLFFNSVFHLNKQGEEQRTDSIIKMLKSYIKSRHSKRAI